jgi:hypothetical protein
MADELNKPSRGTGDWDIPVNENFDKLEAAARAFIARGSSEDIDVGGVISPELIDGSGRTRPTAQLQSRSALAAPTNAESVVFNRAPVNDEAAQGTESVLTLLQSGIDPAVVLRRELDGQGGAYKHQLDAPLGRFARINTNLSFEYDSFADVPNWKSADEGVATINFNAISRPRRLQIDTEGDGNGNRTNAGIQSSVLTTAQSLGGFKITFQDVTYSDNFGNDNDLRIGISDRSANEDTKTTGNGIILRTQGDGGFNVIENGSRTELKRNTGPFGPGDANTPVDISISYDGSETAIFADGKLKAGPFAFSVNADFSPIVQINNRNNSAPEVAEIGQVTVEPFSEVLQ